MKNKPIIYFEKIGLWRSESHLFRAYTTGFILSILLTFGAYMLAVYHLLPFQIALIILLALAFVQFIVQVLCFLHLGKESNSRDRVIVLVCAVVIVGILLWGSLWIMTNLNGRMMPTVDQMQEYMNNQDGI
jgi:cytochrome o ubiquinol oxidase subunit IV